MLARGLPLFAARGGAVLGTFRLPPAVNEPILSYARGTPERAKLEAAINKIDSECPDVPIVIGGKEYRVGEQFRQPNPSNHKKINLYLLESK